MTNSCEQNEIRREVSMREAFSRQKREVLKRAREGAFRKPSDIYRIGGELEASVITKVAGGSISPASEKIRDSIVRASLHADKELGAAQIETRTDAETLGIRSLHNQIQERMDELNNLAMQHGTQILYMGINPFIAIADITCTNAERYRQVPEFHNKHRTPGTNTRVGPIDANNAKIIAVCNALHINTEAKSPADAIRTANIRLMRSPYATALGANARYIGGQDSRYADIRMALWTASHRKMNGDKTRVGLPDNYYESPEDYLQQVGHYPFILDDPAYLNHLQLSN